MVMMVMTPLAVAKNWAIREWYVFCSSRDVIDGWSVSGLVKGGGCGREKVLVASKEAIVAARLLDGKKT